MKLKFNNIKKLVLKNKIICLIIITILIVIGCIIVYKSYKTIEKFNDKCNLEEGGDCNILTGLKFYDTDDNEIKDKTFDVDLSGIQTKEAEQKRYWGTRYPKYIFDQNDNLYDNYLNSYFENKTIEFKIKPKQEVKLIKISATLKDIAEISIEEDTSKQSLSLYNDNDNDNDNDKFKTVDFRLENGKTYNIFFSFKEESDYSEISNLKFKIDKKYQPTPTQGSLLSFDGNWTQLGKDIDGEANNDISGSSVSLSSDGKIVAIGSPFNDSNNIIHSGHVRIFEFNGTEWKKLGQNINGIEKNDELGSSVSLSSDGKIVAIGAPTSLSKEEGKRNGYVRIYKYNGTEWIQLGKDINGKTGKDQSGYSISLSSNGKIVAIGSPYNSSYNFWTGHVRIFEWNGTEWIQLGKDINGEDKNNRSGSSLSLSSDGKIVAIGTPGGGYVKVYQFDNKAWKQLGEKIVGEAHGDQSGHSVSLSSDGKIVAIGAKLNDGNDKSPKDNKESFIMDPYNEEYWESNGYKGHVRVYRFNNGTEEWSKLGEDIDGISDGDQLGYSVSLSSDGTIIAIGSPYNDGNKGRVIIYKYNGEEWIQLGKYIHGEAKNDMSGTSVSLSSDGKIVAIKSPFNDSGHVRVYKYNNPPPTTTTTTTTTQPTTTTSTTTTIPITTTTSTTTTIPITTTTSTTTTIPITTTTSTTTTIPITTTTSTTTTTTTTKPSLNVINDQNIKQLVSDYYDKFNTSKKDEIISKYGKISDWDTRNVTSMFGLFQDEKAIDDISKWNTSNVKNMALMFFSASNFNQDISTKIVNKGQDNEYIAWDTSNVTEMTYMFNGAEKFNQNIGNWNTSKVNNMSGMFTGVFSFNHDISTKFVNLDQDEYQTSSVSKMMKEFFTSNFFTDLNGKNIQKSYVAWDTSNVTDMSYMFNSALEFNKNIGNWNTDKVTNMEGMFGNTNKFNQDISTKQVNLQTEKYTAWNTSNVNNMSLMFYNTKKFNQNISNWNTSKVYNMQYMFNSSEEFNQNILSWDLTSLKDATEMFLGAIAFNDKFTNYCPTFNYSIICYIKPKYTTTTTKPTTTKPTTTQPTTTKPTTTKPTTTKPVPTTTKPVPTTTKPIKKETNNGSWKYESNMSDSGEGGYALYVSPYSGHANVFLPATEFYNL